MYKCFLFLFIIVLFEGKSNAQNNKGNIPPDLQKKLEEEFPKAKDFKWYNNSDQGYGREYDGGRGWGPEFDGEWNNEEWDNGIPSQERNVYPNFFEVHFNYNSKKYFVFYTSEGELFYIKIKYEFTQLPKIIQDSFNNSIYKNHKIISIYELIKPNESDKFKINFKNHFLGRHHILMNKDGNLKRK